MHTAYKAKHTAEFVGTKYNYLKFEGRLEGTDANGSNMFTRLREMLQTRDV